jgi:hypothetical protein
MGKFLIVGSASMIYCLEGKSYVFIIFLFLLFIENG